MMQRITTKKMKEFQVSLIGWYELHGRKFPWRKKNLTHYQVIIAEVLLQRTRAKTVSTFYSSFITEFPNWTAIARADLIIIEDYLKPIGLYKQRAKRLHKLALEMERRNGKLPKDRQELEKMPFFGQYIANAIELIIFDRPRPLIDVNLTRLIERYFGKRKMADIRYDPYLQKLAQKVVDRPDSKSLNWAILDYASIICKAHNPLCAHCMLNKKCLYYKGLIFL
jgi:A/G-specific adenine glycosylase